VRVWDAATGALVRSVTDRPAHVTAIGFSADGRRLAVANRADRVVVWDVATGAVVREFAGAIAKGVNAVALFGDGRRLATGSSEVAIGVWDVDTGRAVHTFRE